MLRYANVSPIVFMEKGSPFVPMATFNYGGKIKKWGKRERVFVKSSIFAAEEQIEILYLYHKAKAIQL